MNRSLSILFVFVALFIFKTARTQDIIVTSLNDSINCKILTLFDDEVRYRYVYGKTTRIGSISKKQIVFLAFNYYKKSVKLQEEAIRRETLFPYKSIRLGSHIGFSYLTAEPSDYAPSFLQDYYNDLRKGWHLSFDAAWYFSTNVGVAVVYDRFKTDEKYENQVIATYPNGMQRIGNVSDDITNHFWGAGISLRGFTNKRNICFIGDLSAGRIYYHNNAEFIDSYEITGNTIGVKLNLCVDFRLDENLALTVGASRLFGVMKEATFKDASGYVTKSTLTEPEDLSRLDVYAGVRLYLF